MNGAYINHLDSDAGMQAVLDNIPGSATTDYLLLSLNVAGVDTSGKPSADINYGWDFSSILASGGQVTQWTKDHLVKVVSTGVTQGKCKRVWLVIGGASNGPKMDTFTNIQNILNAGGKWSSDLLANFKALHSTFKQIKGVESVGFDMDYEEDESVLATVVTNVSKNIFTQTGCLLTFCPFQGEQDDNGNYPGEQQWITALRNVNSWTNGAVVGYNLQTYSGGGSNNPKQWADYIADAGIVSDPYSFVWPIVSNGTDDATPQYTPDQLYGANGQGQLTNWVDSTTGPTGFHSKGASLWATSGLPDPPKKLLTLTDYSNTIAQGIA